MTSEQPFKFAVPDNELALLKRKLDDTCLSDEVNPADGPTARQQVERRVRLAHAQAQAERASMFMRTIGVDGFGELSMHYMHQQSAAKGAILLLFVHGCTSSLVSTLPSRCEVVHGAKGQEASSR